MQPIIDINSASVFHRDNRYSAVLRDVTFSIEAGELVYLIGRVGSGKSSLLRTLYGELPLRQGQARVCGFNLAGLGKGQIPTLRRQLGVVFQEYNLLNDITIYENLEFVLRATSWRDSDAINRRIEQVLDLVGMRDKAYKRPSQVSGGERQHICIARAMLNSPRLIIADEPTGNLDPVAADSVIELFNSIAAGGCTVLLSTHNSENLRRFPSRTLHCAGGFVEELL